METMTDKPLCQQGLPCKCAPEWVACPCEDGNPPLGYDKPLSELLAPPAPRPGFVARLAARIKG